MTLVKPLTLPPSHSTALQQCKNRVSDSAGPFPSGLRLSTPGVDGVCATQTVTSFVKNPDQIYPLNLSVTEPRTEEGLSASLLSG